MGGPTEQANEGFERIVSELAAEADRTAPAVPQDPSDRVAWVHERIRQARAVFARSPHRIVEVVVECLDLGVAQRAAESWGEGGIAVAARRRADPVAFALRDGEVRLWIFAAWDPQRQDPNDPKGWLMAEDHLTGIAPTPAQQELISDQAHLDRAWALGAGCTLEEALLLTREG